MGFKCGIVGLPNVGKSTLFNALTATIAAEAANYPFCTIEPNHGIVAVPDERLSKLAALEGSQKIIPAQMEFVDIAGLVAGASKGEGLGNKFLAHIREVDAIIHVLRCFEDTDITHVHGGVNPLRDAEIIETELILADLDSVEKRLPNLEKKAKAGDKASKEQYELLKPIAEVLASGQPVRSLIQGKDDAEKFKSLNLLTSKPILYVCNVLEEEATGNNSRTLEIEAKARKEGAESIIISSKIEAEIANLESNEDKAEFLSAIGLKETGLNKIIRAGYKILNLNSYFTIGPKEAHAWTFKTGTTAQKAAGIIHTDFEKGFIRAEVISYEDYLQYSGEAGAREAGKIRLEGKDYYVKDGDIIHFRFNV